MTKKNYFFCFFLITIFLMGSAAGSPAKAAFGKIQTATLFFGACVENWSCGPWSICSLTALGGMQTRACTDLNNCGTTNNKPPTTQGCTVPTCSVASDCPAIACNTASCSAGHCAYSNSANGTSCADGLFCNGDETCQNGTCQNGVFVACASYLNSCAPIGQCSESLGSCEYIPNNSLCDDNIPCTADRCDVFLGCISVPDDLKCNDGIACTVDTCSKVNGCRNDAAACAVINGNPDTYNFCPNPVGIRPCTAAVWKVSPDCRWDTSQCSPSELNQACTPMEKRCSSNFLQQCKVAAPALWENIRQCPYGCNEELLDCNVSECIEDWKCTDWSPCASNAETRLCSDAANCGTAKNKPVETMACSTVPACGDGTCSPEENNIFCPADCKIIKLPEASTENLVLLTFSLLIFGGFAVIVSQMLTTRQRI